ncbi:MAG: beta strand repeat-containing protein, partial [Chthoniobacterales bacterium]
MKTTPATPRLRRSLCLVAITALLLLPAYARAGGPAQTKTHLEAKTPDSPVQLDPETAKAFAEEAQKRSLEQPATEAPFAVAPTRSPQQKAAPLPDAPIMAVRVTATAGTTGPTDYATLGAAFTAINAGTHQGAIAISIQANSVETGPAVLNSNGAGSASYTSVLIQPTADALTITGATATGRGLIELNGADNVTIDGDNPNSAGTNRDLTIANTAANTITFTSVIRIALATTIVTSADNNTIKNLNILGSGTGRNSSGVTSEVVSYGILATGGASTTNATTAPSAIASSSTTIGAGATANSFAVQNNFVNLAARAVAVQGSATTVFPNLLIENNTIGNATSGAVDGVYTMGVTAQGSTSAVIRGNTVYVESFFSTATRGLDFGGVSTTGSGAVFERNKVLRVHNNNTTTFGSYGISVAGGTNHIVQNNFVADVLNSQTAGSGAFSTTFGALGIRVGGGTGHRIYHNSVHLSGVVPGAVSTDLTAAFALVGTGQTGCDVRNNIFSNQLTGGNPAANSTRHAVVFLPSGATSALTLTWNNNGYYQGPNVADPKSELAQTGTTAGSGEYYAANFIPGLTTPASNFRSYTSTLGNAANDNSSFATATSPPVTSSTDLHIPNGTATKLESGGASLPVATDIDLEARNAITPDIGADEFAGVAPCPNDIAALSFVVPSNGGSLSNGGTVTPQANFQNAGTATQTNVMVQFTITGPSGYNYTDTQSIASIIPNQVVTVVFAMAPTFSSAGAYSMTAQVVTPDCLAMNDSINGAFQVSNPIGGNVTVGTGGTYPSLTNAGGVFEAINGGGLFGNLTINVVSDLTSETGAVGLNQWSETGAGNYTVTIRPSGAARSITGSTASTGLVRFVGASRVTIDGSVGGGGSDRSLTIENTNTTGPIVVLFGSVGSTPISNDTLKNCTIRNGANTSSAVVTSDAGTPGNPGFFTNVTIQNNSIQKAYIGAYSNGGAAPTQGGSNLSYLDNDLTSSGANAIRDVGLYMQGVNGATVSRNSIGKLDTTNDEDDRGIWAASGTTNAVISRNTITGIGYTGTAGFGAHGIAVSTGTANANVVISNNMISNITGDGFDVASFPADNPYGMYISGTQSGIKIYYNSINLFGNTLNQTGALSAGIVIGTGTTAVDLANNVVTNNLGLSAASGTGAVGIWLQTAATQLSSAMNNDYLVNPSGGGTKNIGRISATNSATLANWQAATGKETNSISADPLFSASTNLHINCGSPVIALGVPIGGLTTDFDGQTRDAVPEMGADELVAPTPSSAVSRFIHTG